MIKNEKGDVKVAHIINLKTEGLEKIRDINPRLVSYNVEMTEVTGGTFWKAYTEGQIAGTEEFPKLEGGFQNHTAMAGLMQYYPPIDTTNEKLISLAKELGSVWVRVSGTWATKTYYDFDGTTGGKAPEGYQSVLTREQWANIVNFVKEIDGKLLVSASNCAGDHKDGAPLDLTQIKKLFALTDELGGRIDAFEFMNGAHSHHISDSRAHLCHWRILNRGVCHACVAGTNDKTVGIVLLDPRVCNILVAHIVLEGIAKRRAGDLKHIRLVHKLEGIDPAAKLIGKSEELFDLCEVERCAVLVVACTV